MAKANLRPFLGQAGPCLGRCRCRCQPRVRARPKRLWGRLFSAGEPQGCCHGSPPPRVPAPKHSWQRARGPWALFLLLTCRTSHSSIHLSKASGAGAAHPSLPPPQTHRHRAPTRHLRFARENHSSARKSQAAKGGASVRPGRHGRGNPSSTDALFIRRFSIPRLGGEARPSSSSSSSSPTPTRGDTGARSLPHPWFKPCVLRWDFTWRTAASLLRTKPRELYSDTRELLAREEEHGGRLPAAGHKKVAGWSLRHRERRMRCSFLGRKRDWSLRPGWFAAESVWSEPKKTSTRTSTHRHHAQRCILTSPAFCFLAFTIISQAFKHELNLPHTNLSSL